MMRTAPPTAPCHGATADAPVCRFGFPPQDKGGSKQEHQSTSAQRQPESDEHHILAPTTTVPLSPSIVDPHCIEEAKRTLKVKKLKNAFDGIERLATEEFGDDMILLEVYMNNFDFVQEDSEGSIVARPQYKGLRADDVPWRLYNYATFQDLKKFALTSEPWPQMGVPLTIVHPCHLVLLETKIEDNARATVQSFMEHFEACGEEISKPADEINYGDVLLLVRKGEDGSTFYLRVVTLSFLGEGQEEFWLVTPIDCSDGLTEEPLMKIPIPELYQLPLAIDIGAIRPSIFLARLRGLDEIKAGCLDLARKSLTADVVLPVIIEDVNCLIVPGSPGDDGVMTIDLLVNRVNEQEEIVGELVSEILYCKGLGIPTGQISEVSDHPFWARPERLLLDRPDVDEIVNEILYQNKLGREESQYLGSQESLQDTSGKSDHMIPAIDEARQPAIPTINQDLDAEEQKRLVDCATFFQQQIMHAMEIPSQKTLIMSMLKLCKETSDVTDEEYDFLLQCFSL